MIDEERLKFGEESARGAARAGGTLFKAAENIMNNMGSRNQISIERTETPDNF